MTVAIGFLLALSFLAPAWAAEKPLSAIQADLEAGRVERALAALEAHLAVHPGDPKARFIKGLALARAGDEPAAIAVFQSLAEDYPSLPEPHNNLAVLYASRGEYIEARDALMAAIRTHPSYATAHENLGDIFARMAAEAYDKALALDQRNRTAQAKLALVSELFSLPAPEVEVAAGPAQGPGEGAGGPVVDRSMDSASEPADPPRPSPEPELRRALNSWAEAWSGQRVDDYLAHYSEDFVPEDGLTREAWAAQRRERLRAPRRIELALDDVGFRRLAEGAAEARFVQTYRSDTYQDRVNKVLQLVREGGDWKIRQEYDWPVVE